MHGVTALVNRVNKSICLSGFKGTTVLSIAFLHLFTILTKC